MLLLAVEGKKCLNFLGTLENYEEIAVGSVKNHRT